MTRFMVYGTSDDLIDVQEVVDYPCNIVPVAEYGIYNTSEEAPAELHFSDGTILHVWYGEGSEGIWRVKIHEQGSAGIVIVPAEGDEEGIYSDVAFVTAPALKFEKCMCEGSEVTE